MYLDVQNLVLDIAFPTQGTQLSENSWKMPKLRNTFWKFLEILKGILRSL